MSRDPLARMDIDTRWPYHRKCRALQAAYPSDWPSYWCAYLALLGESWAGTERLTLRDAWVPSLPVTIDAALAALVDVGLLDKSGKVPTKSWDEWFGPAAARLDSLRERGRKGAETRWNKREKAPNGHRPSDGTAMAEPSASNGRHMRHASQTNHAVPATPAIPAAAGRAPSGDAYDVMLKVEALTRRPFNYREGHQIHDTLVGDVAAHGAETMAEHYARFQAENGRCDTAQLVFGVHNVLHPLIKAKPMTEAERKEAEIQAAIAQIKAETAGVTA